MSINNVDFKEVAFKFGDRVLFRTFMFGGPYRGFYVGHKLDSIHYVRDEKGHLVSVDLETGQLLPDKPRFIDVLCDYFIAMKDVPASKWRLLEVGEVLREGDEFYSPELVHSQPWSKAPVHLIGRELMNLSVIYIRKCIVKHDL